MLLTEVGFPVQNSMNLYYDNKVAINITHDPVQHDRTKHVEVDRHFIKDHVKAIYVFRISKPRINLQMYLPNGLKECNSRH